MSIFPLKNNLNWSNRNVMKVKMCIIAFRGNLFKKVIQVSYLSFFDVLENYPPVSNVIQGLKYKRSQAIK